MPKRPGRTVKVSISLDRRDLEALKKTAKRVSSGNLSGAIAEMIRIGREWEGREMLAAWLGEGHAEPSEEVMDAIRAEWRAPRSPKGRTRAA